MCNNIFKLKRCPLCQQLSPKGKKLSKYNFAGFLSQFSCARFFHWEGNIMDTFQGHVLFLAPQDLHKNAAEMFLWAQVTFL